MGFDFLNDIQNARKSVVLLQPVERLNLLSSLDPRVEVCEYESSLTKGYYEAKRKRCIDKCVLMILHSIYQDGKRVFGLSRKVLQSLYESNPNLPDESFSNKAYSHLTVYLKSLGIVQLVESTSKQCRLYYVSEEFKYLSFIQGDVESQLKSALELRKPYRDHISEELEKLLLIYPECNKLILE